VLDLFNPERLEEILGPAEGETDEIARRFLCLAGKRWRPLLCAYAWQAFSQTDTNAPLPPAVAAAAVAVECFHKASLVHDDIEDGDVERYGRATLHVEHGVPVALNCGDLLLGEGYRLLSACDAPADLRAAMAATAAAGHRQLCRGQGAELCWTRSPTPLTVEQVVEVFAYKTAAAFEVALRIGAILSGVRDAATHDALARYSQALGVAYQIRDDLADFAGDGDGLAGRPSLLFALAWRDADGARRKRLRGLADANRAESNDAVALVRQLGEAPAQRMFQAYKERAIQAAHTLKSPRARELLTRLVSQIFTGP
jgi:geranylgeranyl pyrophosphate synthase